MKGRTGRQCSYCHISSAWIMYMEGRSLQGEHFVDVWQMHLETMLVFVDASAHGLKAPFLFDLTDECSIYDEVAQWSAVFVATGGGSAGEVVVMRRPEQEDPLAVYHQ